MFSLRFFFNFLLRFTNIFGVSLLLLFENKFKFWIRTRRRRKTLFWENWEKKNLTMFYECARKHKVFLVVMCTRTMHYHRFAATTTHRHRRTDVCVKVAVCVFFVVFSTTSVSQETRRFILLFCWEKPRQRNEKHRKKEFLTENCEKGISVLMVFCFHVDVSCTSIPRNLLLFLSQK
jgi:hypothetical protein